jgi:hypothetical protein
MELLTDDGLIVSLCFDGVRQNRELRPIASSWEVLPAGSFKEAGTMASVVLATFKKSKAS